MIDLLPRGILPVLFASIRQEEGGTSEVDTVPKAVFSIGVTRSGHAPWVTIEVENPVRHEIRPRTLLLPAPTGPEALT
jgi:hypothetical protein